MAAEGSTFLYLQGCSFGMFPYSQEAGRGGGDLCVRELEWNLLICGLGAFCIWRGFLVDHNQEAHTSNSSNQMAACALCSTHGASSHIWAQENTKETAFKLM